MFDKKEVKSVVTWNSMISGYAEDSAAYVLLSNMFAESGDWQERAKVRKLIEE